MSAGIDVLIVIVVFVVVVVACAVFCVFMFASKTQSEFV